MVPKNHEVVSHIQYIVINRNIFQDKLFLKQLKEVETVCCVSEITTGFLGRQPSFTSAGLVCMSDGD